MKNRAPPTKIFFPKHHHLKALKKRVSKNPITSNLKIEFFKDQCSLEEYEVISLDVNFFKNVWSTELYN
jgi:hypothetical protein